MPNILVATVGQSWQVVPELLGYTNPADVPLFAEAPHQVTNAFPDDIGPIDEIWAVTTDSQPGRNAAQRLFTWNAAARSFKLRVWSPDGISDVVSEDESRKVADLIYRVVLHARDKAGEGQVVLSLAGGRKTMSAELQQAGRVFGCSAMLHIVGDLPKRDSSDWQVYNALTPEDWTRPLPAGLLNCFIPVVISRELPPFDLIRRLRPLADQFSLDLPDAGELLTVAPTTALYDKVHEYLKSASQLYENYHSLLVGESARGSAFRALYLLPSSDVRRLRDARIGGASSDEHSELEWLRRIPKAELHCHLGGVLSPSAMIKVAGAIEDQVMDERRSNPDFDRAIREIEDCVAGDDMRERLAKMKIVADDIASLRTRWGCREPIAVAAFLLAFRDAPAALDEFIFGRLLDRREFRGIKFRPYARLGDLQGSGLLQCRETIRATIRYLGELCRSDNIRYLELRCSPLNYTQGGLTAEEVVGEILAGIQEIEWCDIRLVFIVSRHRCADGMTSVVKLAQRLLKHDGEFRERFVGCDLAGDEKRCAPLELRDLFAPLREQVIRLTIHAGEIAPVGHIWQAVYELSADRVGHGLSLVDNPCLLKRFRDRSIAIELCPSSNDQIVGFKDNALGGSRFTRQYPLVDYLQAGLRVTVNTDNPGISRTTLSREYWKAACMTPGGLTKWQILQIVRNGFRSAFCDYETRCRMLQEVEREVASLVQSEPS